jgi:putative endonuclease
MTRRTDPNGKPPAENGVSAGRRAAFRLGLSAERQAAGLLLVKGYRVVARRFRSGVGEVDIVARHGDLLVFVEVKARERLDDAAEAVTPRQQRRIIAAAEAWRQGDGRGIFWGRSTQAYDGEDQFGFVWPNRKRLMAMLGNLLPQPPCLTPTPL